MIFFICHQRCWFFRERRIALTQRLRASTAPSPTLLKRRWSSSTFLIFCLTLELLVLGTVPGDGEPGAPVQLFPQSRPIHPPPKAGLQGTQLEGVDREGGEGKVHNKKGNKREQMLLYVRMCKPKIGNDDFFLPFFLQHKYLSQ